MDKTDRKIDTPLTQPRSGPVRYELVNRLGNACGKYESVVEAVYAAMQLWPDQEQDEDRTGRGWDVELVS